MAIDMQAIMAALMGRDSGSEMFMRPQPLDGSRIDPTEGRGWADERGPESPMLRASRRWAERLQRDLDAQDQRVLANVGFDKVNLTPEEELFLELRKKPEDVGRDVALFGAEHVRRRRGRILAPVIDQIQRGTPPTS